ncbi:MAG: M12 family metallo-peptidase [Acidobacteria bacterium]|nr:M12 family metallo-peptidase [Acidobacteriota bacterium]
MRVILAAVSIFWATGSAIAAGGQQPSAGQSGDQVWQAVSAQARALDARRPDLGGPYSRLRFNKTAFDAIARRAQRQRAARNAVADVILTLPMPDGRYERFRVQESPILAPELAAAFPEFKTYRGQGLDDPAATTRFGWTAAGFHAIILSAGGTVYIDPWARGNLDDYVSFRKADAVRQGARPICMVGDAGHTGQSRGVDTFPITNGDTKRTYVLALAATGEYTAAAGGTKELALARMTTTINRVTGIYERDLSVTLTLKTGTTIDPTALIYLNGSTDPYTNTDAVAMIDENQSNLDAVVGTASYDVGHVFSSAGGGFADVGVICSASFKAKGATGLSNPTGDAFDVDYVAHELGHQFGGDHTFNSTSSDCGGSARSSTHAYEVGSGSTIMAYAGICSPENLQPNSNDQFHVESLNQITAYLTSGAGASCGTTSATGNALPDVSGGSNYTIPKQTPFTLTATGSDADTDPITYQWEEFDLGTASSSVATATTDDGSRPLFRSYLPSSSPTRTFPSLAYILNNANVPPATYLCSSNTCLTGETLAVTNRTMNFQVTARDNHSGGGAVATSRVQVTVTTAAGPFAVTSPNSSVGWTSGAQTVTWIVAGTSASPVSAADVKISLSTDGGITFPTVLTSSTPNTGSAVVAIPDAATTTARIKVEAVGNIFFDISDADFAIVGPPAAPTLTTQPSDQSVAPGGAASFTAAASGNPAPTVMWQVSTDGGSTWTDIAGAASPTYAFTASIADNGKRYQAVFTNSSGSATSNSAELTVYGPATARPSSLSFGAVKAVGSATLSSQTPAQTVVLTFSIASSVWTATTTDAWLSVTPGSGAGAGTFTVAIVNPGDTIGASTSLSGAVTMTSPTASNSPLTIPVTLTVLRPGASAPPFGAFDTPGDGTTGMQGSFAVTGWALDDVAIDRVEIWRDLVLGEDPAHAYTTDPAHPANGKVFIASPLFVTYARPDVEGIYAGYPAANRAGWGYLLLSWGLEGQGNGPYTLYSYAFDVDGHWTSLGSKAIAVDNAHASKPFGSIDTPGYGETKSGVFVNFGWALTPVGDSSCRIDNGHVWATVDSLPAALVNYGDARSDIASSFPGFLNSTNASGSYYVDTTALTNGRHQIGWLVYDTCGRGDGIGSRFFNVLNGGARGSGSDPTVGAPLMAPDRETAVAAGRDESRPYAGTQTPEAAHWAAPAAAARPAASSSTVSVRHLGGDWEDLPADAEGGHLIDVTQGGRIEVQLPPAAGGAYTGHIVVNAERRPLPLGSSFDAMAGIFYWQPDSAFLGAFDLAFEAPGTNAVRVRVVVK